MRKRTHVWLLGILFSLLFWQISLSKASGNAFLALEPTQIVLNQIGQRFQVDILCSEVVNLGGFQMNIVFPPEILQVEDIWLSDFLSSTGNSLLPLPPSINNTLGTVTIGAASFGVSPGPNGQGLLASCIFTVTGLAQGQIALENPILTTTTAATIPVTIADNCNLVPPVIEVSLNPQVITLGRVGGTFEVNLMVKNIYNLGAFSFHLNFPPSLVTIDPATGLNLGSFLGSTGNEVTILEPKLLEPGQISFGAYSFGSSAGPDGDGTLCTLTFQVLDSGGGSLELDQVQLTTLDGLSLTSTLKNAELASADSWGPALSSLSLSPEMIAQGDSPVAFQAQVSDAGRGDSLIASVEYFIQQDPGQGLGTPVQALDGAFDEVTEEISAQVETSSWSVEQSPYLFGLRGLDQSGNWSTTVFRWIFVQPEDQAPEVTQFVAVPMALVAQHPRVHTITIEALVDDTNRGHSKIVAVEYLDGDADGPPGGVYNLEAVDGLFDSPTERVRAVIETSEWLPENSPYKIGLIAQDEWGNRSSPVYTQVWVTDQALAEAGPDQEVFEGQTVILDGSISAPYGQATTITSYLWDFDEDGAYDDGSGANPTFTWTEDGQMDISLLVTDNLGITSKDIMHLVIKNAKPQAEAGGPYQGYEGSPLLLTGTAIDPGTSDILTLAWDLDGDGLFDDALGRQPSYTWKDDYQGNIYLRVTDDDGASSIAMASLTITNQNPAPFAPTISGSEGQNLSIQINANDPGIFDTHDYFWDFDEDGVYEQQTDQGNLTHSWPDNFFGYMAVKVVDDDGGLGAARIEVSIQNALPQGNPGGPYHGLEGVPLQLTSQVSDPGLGDTFTYAWDLDDDGQFDDSTSPTPSYTWFDDYSGEIGLRITDKDGGQHTSNTQVQIANQAPACEAGSEYRGLEGESLQLLGTAEDPSPGDILTYLWDIDGDGQFDDAWGPQPSYPWPDNADRLIQLKVIDDDGGFCTDSVRVVIENQCPSPVVEPIRGESNQEIRINVAVNDPAIADTHTFEWDWDNDGTFDQNVSSSLIFHTWGQEFLGQARLKVTDDDGCSQTITIPVQIADLTPPPEVTNLRAEVTGSSIQLNWLASANTSGDLEGYKLYISRDGGRNWGHNSPEYNDNQSLALSSQDLSYLISSLGPGTQLVFKITTYDEVPNESRGTQITATTLLNNPQGLTARAGDTFVDLSWIPLEARYIKYYQIYQSETDFTEVSQMTYLARATTNKYSVTGLTNEKTYYFAVTSVNSSDEENPTVITVSAMPIGDQIPPARIGGLKAVRGDTLVSLTWTANTEGDFSHYLVYYSQNPFDNVSQLSSASLVNQNAAQIRNLQNGLTYYFAVTAVDLAGNENQNVSNVSAIPADILLPTEPADLLGLAKTQKVELQWSQNQDPDFDHFLIIRDTEPICDGSGPGESALQYTLDDPNATSYPVTGLENDQTYYFALAVVDQDENKSSLICFEALTPHTETPVLTIPTKAGHPIVELSKVIILGGYSVPGASIELFKSGNLLTTVQTTSTGEFSLSSVQLSAGVNQFTARATVDGTSSELSLPIEVSYDPIPSQVTGLSAQAGDTKINLLWQAVPDVDIAGYFIYRGSEENPRNLLPVVGTSYVDGGLTNGQAYSYRVKAVDQHGSQGTASSSITAVPIAGSKWGEVSE